MSSADPFLAASSMTQLFPRTLGPAASAAADAPSPSRALGALLDGVSRHMKGSKELVEQARIATKEHGDIGKLYHDDGARVAAAANGKNNQQGRRPALGLKRSRFTIKAPTDNPVQNVDFSVLHNIEDPDEYFLALEKLEKAEKEIKRLRGEAPTEAIGNHRAINPSEMRPGLLRRKSVHSYKFTLSTDIPDAMKAPFSQTDTITESQFTQDDVHASSPEMTKELVLSRSSQHAIPDVSVRKDSFAEKDESSTLSYLLSSFKNLDEAEEENLLRETLQIKEISVGKLCLPDFNVSVDMPASSSTAQKNPMSGHTPERNVPGGHLDRILQLEKHIFAGDALKDKHADPIDDESDGSPESVVREGSLVQGSSVLVDSTVGEVSAIRETQSPSTKSPEHVLEPEPNPPKSATIDEGLEGSSPIGVHTDIEPAKEKGASCSRSVSLEENDTTMDYLVSSPCHQEGDSTEALASTPSGNVSPLQQRDANSEHQEMAGADAAQGLEHTLLTDKPVHTSEIPPEDTYRQNRSDLHHANIEELAANISNALSPSKGKEQKGKAKKQPSKRGKKVTGEPSNLEIPSPDFDPENQPHMQDTDVEQQTTHASNSPSPSKDKRQKEARRRNKKQDLNKRKSLVDAGLTWQSGVRRSTRIRSRPLQHWLGERFVYGRIHGTMATVIGVKSLSPSQEGKAAMRVKSFVPEQYSDLLAKSARY